MEQLAAIYQMFQEFPSLVGVCHCANVIVVYGVGGQEIKEDVRSLQPQAVGSAVVMDSLFERIVVKLSVGIQPKKVMCRKSGHGFYP